MFCNIKLVHCFTISQELYNFAPAIGRFYMEGIEARKLALDVIRTRRAFKLAVCKSLRQHGVSLTFEMLQVVNSLWQEEGVSQQTLAERISKNKASLTALINNLEKKGYIYRKPCESDRRNKHVFLTEEGRMLKGTVLPAIDDVYGFVEREIGIENIKIYQNLLMRLYGIVESY